MHAAIDPPEVGDEVKSGPAPVRKRVEQTDLDVGVGIEGGDDRIAGLVVGIVDEEPNPDPAVGRLEHVVEYDPAGRIAVPDIILHIQASLGQVGQRQTDDERLAALAQEAEAGQAWMFVGRGGEQLAQPGGRVVLERGRRRARIVGPRASGAAGEKQGEANQDRVEETATGQCLRPARARRAARSLRAGDGTSAVRNPAGHSAAHRDLQPATASRQARQRQSGQAKWMPSLAEILLGWHRLPARWLFSKAYGSTGTPSEPRSDAARGSEVARG